MLAAYFNGGVFLWCLPVGFLTVLGIVARNGIMLINHYQQLEQNEGETLVPGSSSTELGNSAHRF
jgi:multidrug efflux pump subunit AcrB